MPKTVQKKALEKYKQTGRMKEMKVCMKESETGCRLQGDDDRKGAAGSMAAGCQVRAPSHEEAGFVTSAPSGSCSMQDTLPRKAEMT